MSALDVAPLTFLSLQHCPPGTVPEAFTNEERRRALRNALPASLHNDYPWAHLPKPKEEPACPPC